MVLKPQASNGMARILASMKARLRAQAKGGASSTSAPGLLSPVVIAKDLVAPHGTLQPVAAWQGGFEQVGMVGKTAWEQFHAQQVAAGGDPLQQGQRNLARQVVEMAVCHIWDYSIGRNQG